MRNVERLLSLLTTPERASAIVGDLVEQYSGARLVWAVARTGVALLFRGAWSAPWRMAACMLAGGLLNLIVFPIGVRLVHSMAAYLLFDALMFPMMVAGVLSWMNPGREVTTLWAWWLLQVGAMLAAWYLVTGAAFAALTGGLVAVAMRGAVELAVAVGMRRYRMA